MQLWQSFFKDSKTDPMGLKRTICTDFGGDSEVEGFRLERQESRRPVQGSVQVNALMI